MIEPRTKRPCPDCGDWLPNATATICPRCAGLADLEREIGQITVGQAILDRIAERLVASDKGHAPTILNLVYNLLVDERMLLEARWRQLHAEGAEEADQAST